MERSRSSLSERNLKYVEDILQSGKLNLPILPANVNRYMNQADTNRHYMKFSFAIYTDVLTYG